MSSRQRLYILSLPRSGSTLLSRFLDEFDPLLSLPESAFPQILDLISESEWTDREWVAALFQTSSFSGAILDLSETAACIRGDRFETLEAIETRCAEKLGRDPGALRWVAWKTTRVTSRTRWLADSGGRFLILRRNPLNVFQSQFRVHFGLHNRNPLRFALFRASYEAGFSRCPRPETFEIEYARLPEALPALLAWLGLGAAAPRQQGESGLRVAANRPWHDNLFNAFENRDPEKVAQIPHHQRWLLRAAIAAATPLTPLLLPMRARLDLAVWQTIRARAESLIGRPPNR